VLEDGQIQKLTESQARFRLDSIGKGARPTKATKPTVTTRNTNAKVRGAGGIAPASNTTTTTTNRDILKKFTPQPSPSIQPRAPTGRTSAQLPIPPPNTLGQKSSRTKRIPTWVWVSAAVLALYIFAKS